MHLRGTKDGYVAGWWAASDNDPQAIQWSNSIICCDEYFLTMCYSRIPTCVDDRDREDQGDENEAP